MKAKAGLFNDLRKLKQKMRRIDMESIPMDSLLKITVQKYEPKAYREMKNVDMKFTDLKSGNYVLDLNLSEKIRPAGGIEE